MPDGDIYDRNVSRGWRTASCHVHERDDPGLVVPKLLRAIGRLVKTDGCPEFDVVVRTGATGQLTPAVRARLERIKREAGSPVIDVAVERVLVHLVAPDALLTSLPATPSASDIEIALAKDVLVNAAEAMVAPLQLQGAFWSQDKDKCSTRLARRQRHLETLRSTVELETLAKRLLAGPGEEIAVPAIRIRKPTQEELLDLAVAD